MFCGQLFLHHLVLERKVLKMTRVAFHLPDAQDWWPLDIPNPAKNSWKNLSFLERVRWFFRAKKVYQDVLLPIFVGGLGIFWSPTTFHHFFRWTFLAFLANNPLLLTFGGTPNHRFGRCHLPKRPAYPTSAWERILKPQSFGSAVAQTPAGWPQPQWKSFWWLFLRPELIETGCYVQLSLQKK